MFIYGGGYLHALFSDITSSAFVSDPAGIRPMTPFGLADDTVPTGTQVCGLGAGC
ncbi:MAG: hypothetical protein ACRCS3_11055 [Paracoccaceae bacterium]